MSNDIKGIQPNSLENFGWNPFFQEHFDKLNIADAVPARVISESKNSFQVYSEYGILTAGIAGKMRYRSESENTYPAVGDWVVIKHLAGEEKAIIHAVLPRKSKFSRKESGGRTAEQIISANVDTVFIVAGLDGGRNFNLRRIERYLTLAWNSGAVPVLVLNKVDLCPDVENFIRNVEDIAPGTSIHAVSAKDGSGLDGLKPYFSRGSTVAFLGSSGAGKSTLINVFLGENKQLTGEVREDNRLGRHTTTMREIIELPSGGIVMDTPGMREIQMWGDADGLQEAFDDIENLSLKCRFTDCSHNTEPGCAVRSAADHGKIDPARLESYHKLQKELNYQAAREEQGTRLYEKQKWKKVAKWIKEIQEGP